MLRTALRKIDENELADKILDLIRQSPVDAD